MFNKIKYYLFLFLFLVIGAGFMQVLLNKQNASEKEKRQSELRKSHEETVLRIETGINVYATVVFTEFYELSIRKSI